MTLLTTTDRDGDTLNLGDHVEVYKFPDVPWGIPGEIVKIFKNGKMRVRPDEDCQAVDISPPASVELLYRGDS